MGWKRKGPQPRTKRQCSESLLSRSIRSELGCLVFQGLTDHEGYSSIWYAGHRWRSHRLVYSLHNPDESIAGKVIRHTCDNPSCLEISHLRLGTVQDNVNDRVARKRSAKGEKHSQSKLTNRDIPIIRSRLNRGETQISIARDFKIDPSVISNIKTGILWSHV